MVADMLDLGIAYGQGVVFSPPRPVKPEVFAEPQEGHAGAEEPVPPPRSAPAPVAEVVAYPAPAPVPASSSEARVSFRSVLRRASA